MALRAGPKRSEQPRQNRRFLPSKRCMESAFPAKTFGRARSVVPLNVCRWRASPATDSQGHDGACPSKRFGASTVSIHVGCCYVHGSANRLTWLRSRRNVAPGARGTNPSLVPAPGAGRGARAGALLPPLTRRSRPGPTARRLCRSLALVAVHRARACGPRLDHARARSRRHLPGRRFSQHRAGRRGPGAAIRGRECQIPAGARCGRRAGVCAHRRRLAAAGREQPIGGFLARL